VVLVNSDSFNQAAPTAGVGDVGDEGELEHSH
jgi:hypothetical protein